MGQRGGSRAARAAVVGLVIAFAVPATFAIDINGFLRKKGQGDVALSYTDESYDEFYRGTTKVSTPPPLGKVTTRTASLWAAYGITENLTLYGNLPYIESEGDGTGDMAQSALQDITLLAAYRLGATGSSVRSQFIGAVGGRTPASDYEPDLPVSVGDGTTDALFRFVYLLQTGSFYFSQQIGYDLRENPAPNGFPLYTELGYTVGRTTFHVTYGKYIAKDGTDIGDPGFTFPSNREEYDRIGAKVYFRLTERFGVALAGFTTLDGRNTGNSSGVSLGANYRFAGRSWF